MSFEIKPAQKSDAQTLADIGQRIFHESFAAVNTEENLKLFYEQTFHKDIQEKEILDPKRSIFIVWSGQEAIGYIHLLKGQPEPCVKGPKPAEVLRIYVDQRWHGQGIAQALMKLAIETLKKDGFQTIWLGVWEHNPKAQKFYKKFSFVDCGEHVFWVGKDPQRDIIMERPL